MPIANCFLNHRPVTKNDCNEMAIEWAEKINVDINDICLTFIPECLRGGQQYKILVNLYLPSLWESTDVERIQKSLLEILCNYFEQKPSSIFIMTSIIQSGHVVENGKVIEW